MLSIKNSTIQVEDRVVVKDFSLDIFPATLHLLTGSNGAGKSSIVQLLLGNPAYRLTAGTITFYGQDIFLLEPHERVCKGLFIVQQDAVVIPGLSVITYLKAVYDVLVCQPCSVDQFIKKVEDIFIFVGLDSSFLDRGVHEGFSGGQKKRFELAQVLLFKPLFIIFDEIDAGLDEAGRQLLITIIQRLKDENNQFAALFISHNHHLFSLFTDLQVHELVPISSGNDFSLDLPSDQVML